MLVVTILIIAVLLIGVIAWGVFAAVCHKRILRYRHMLENHHGLDNQTFHQTLTTKRSHHVLHALF